MRQRCLLVMSLFFCMAVFAQEKNLLQKITDDFEKNKQVLNKVHLHTDKSIYSANENIWFTGYIFPASAKEAKHTLYVLLADVVTKKPVASNQYVIENNISKGAFFLPKNILW